MKNPLHDFLTRDEQKVLLTFSSLLLFGFVLMTLGWTPIYAKKAESAKQKLDAVTQEDVVIKVDIRSASTTELSTLPGVGPKRAAAIISYREQSQFQTTLELMKIKGIGQKTFDKMRPNLIFFGADSTAVVEPDMVKSTTKKANSAKAEFAVDLNTATLEQLMTLEGIGAVKAQAIIDYRAENGKFEKVEDITKVKGIGEKTLEKNLTRLIVTF